MRFNTTVTNTSPLVALLPNTLWREKQSSPALQLRTNTSTYHSCNATFIEPSISFSWNGSAIWIYGSRQPKSSPFRVTLDGITHLNHTANTDDGLLFAAVNLAPTAHSITVTNVGEGSSQDNQSPQTLDFNYLTFESSDVGDNTTNVTISGSSEQFQYQDLWVTSPGNIRTTYSSSGAVLNFTGLAISMYGTVGGSQGGYSVSLDGGAWQKYTPNTMNDTTLQLLYFWSGTQVDNHTLIIQNDPSGDPSSNCSSSENALSIAHATVYSTISSSSNPVPEDNIPSPISRSKRIAVIVGTCAGALAVFLVGWIIRRLYLKHMKNRKEALDTRAARPFPKEEPYNPPGAPVIEPIRIEVISRLSDDFVLDISPANNPSVKPSSGENQEDTNSAPLSEKPSHSTITTDTTSVSSEDILRRPPPPQPAPTTPATTRTRLGGNTELRGRPLPAVPRPTMPSFTSYTMAPPPYHNISL